MDMEQMVTTLNYGAIFVAAVSGAAAGIKARADVFGVAVIAFATACSGGIIRDILIGDLPPENIRFIGPLTAALLGGLLTMLLFPQLQWFLKNPVQVFDAFGLGLFTVIGSNKALIYDLPFAWAVLLGVITGVGGGMVRDILRAREPSVLHREIYATSSILGALLFVGGYRWFDLSRGWLMLLGAAACIVLRLLALHYNWHMVSIVVEDSGRFPRKR